MRTPRGLGACSSPVPAKKGCQTMVKRIGSTYFGVLALLATMTLLCMLAGSSGAAAGDTTRVSVDSFGTQTIGGHSLGSATSADGRYVTFLSGATNLVAGDTNGASDVFFLDMQAATTERVSVDSSGTQGNNFSS